MVLDSNFCLSPLIVSASSLRLHIIHQAAAVDAGGVRQEGSELRLGRHYLFGAPHPYRGKPLSLLPERVRPP